MVVQESSRQTVEIYWKVWASKFFGPLNCETSEESLKWTFDKNGGALAQQNCNQFKVDGGQGMLGSPAVWSGGVALRARPLCFELFAVERWCRWRGGARGCRRWRWNNDICILFHMFLYFAGFKSTQRWRACGLSRHRWCACGSSRHRSVHYQNKKCKKKPTHSLRNWIRWYCIHLILSKLKDSLTQNYKCVLCLVSSLVFKNILNCPSGIWCIKGTLFKHSFQIQLLLTLFKQGALFKQGTSFKQGCLFQL